MTSSPNKVLVATCNDFVVGYTRMDTRYIDVEAMGVTSGIIDTENYCASGSEAFRGAVYAVAAGAADIAIAVGEDAQVTQAYDLGVVKTQAERDAELNSLS